MAAELRWPGAHPMTLDVTLDQLGWMRPTKALDGHATYDGGRRRHAVRWARASNEVNVGALGRVPLVILGLPQ